MSRRVFLGGGLLLTGVVSLTASKPRGFENPPRSALRRKGRVLLDFLRGTVYLIVIIRRRKLSDNSSKQTS